MGLRRYLFSIGCWTMDNEQKTMLDNGQKTKYNLAFFNPVSSSAPTKMLHYRYIQNHSNESQFTKCQTESNKGG